MSVRGISTNSSEAIPVWSNSLTMRAVTVVGRRVPGDVVHEDGVGLDGCDNGVQHPLLILDEVGADQAHIATKDLEAPGDGLAELIGDQPLFCLGGFG